MYNEKKVAKDSNWIEHEKFYDYMKNLLEEYKRCMDEGIPFKMPESDDSFDEDDEELLIERQKTATLMLSARFNPNHDSKGRFTTGGAGGDSGYDEGKANLESMLSKSGWSVVGKDANGTGIVKDSKSVNSGGVTSNGVRNEYTDAVIRESKVVEERLSNSYEPIKKESVNLQKVMDRGEISLEDAEKCVAIAESLYEQASKDEPQITEDVVATVKEFGGKMDGLQFRQKQVTSMAGKIGADAKSDEMSFEEAGNEVKDAIRYTAVISEDNFTNGYNQIKSSMEAKGYKEVRCKNFYDSYANNKSSQKAVQCVYENKNGVRFEFQFHTLKSAGAKNINHPMYEEARNETTSDERREFLNGEMRKTGANVPDPPNVMSIRSHG